MTKVKLDYRPLILHYAMTTSTLVDLHVFAAEMLKRQIYKESLEVLDSCTLLLDSSLFINMVESVTGQNCKLCLMSLVLGYDNANKYLHEYHTHTQTDTMACVDINTHTGHYIVKEW